MEYNEVVNSSGTVLVEFFASWCPHCQRMMPVVQQVKELLDSKAEVFQFDIDEYKELAERNKVESIPTFIVYKNGQEAWRQSGEMGADALLAIVQKYM